MENSEFPCLCPDWTEAIEPPSETIELLKNLLVHRPSGIAARDPVHSRLVSATLSRDWGCLVKNNTVVKAGNTYIHA